MSIESNNNTNHNKIDFVNSNPKRRLSLANLVSVHIEKKRSNHQINNRENSNNYKKTSNIKSISNQTPKFANNYNNKPNLKFNIHSIELNMANSTASTSNWSEECTNKDDQGFVSVINRIGEAVTESETLFEFVKKAFEVFFYTKLTTFFLVALAIFHLVMVFIGINHLENCPKEPKIPMYVFVCGSVGFIKILQLIWNQMHKDSEINDFIYNYKTSSFGTDTSNNATNTMLGTSQQTALDKGSRITDAIMNLFIVVWFALGNYWILSIYHPIYDPLLLDPNNWCHRKVYILALVHLIVYYSILILAFFITVLLIIFTRIPYLIIKFQEF